MQELIEEYGWTKSLIKRFLGEPIKEVKNSYGGITKLYDKKKALKVMKSKKFIEAYSIAEKRKEAAKKGVVSKSNKLLDSVTVISRLPKLDKMELYKCSVRYYNDFWREKSTNERYNEKYATIKDDEIFLKRISKNYLRHVCSDYDSSLIDLKGKTGKSFAYSKIKDLITDEIKKQYPYLYE